jgi:stress response protein YsnF
MGRGTGSVRGRRDEMKNKTIKIYRERLTVGKLTKKAKKIYKKVSNDQNLIFK